MAFFDCRFFSETLRRSCAAHVFLPQATTAQIGLAGSLRGTRHPVLYLLHGLSDDHTIWSRRTSIERYAAERGLAVVMPDAGRSFYQDTATGAAYWQYIAEELPALMRSWFPISTERDCTFAAGLSMGGYGALRLGLMYPKRYGAVASLSGALDLVRRVRQTNAASLLSTAEISGIFGPDAEVAGTSADLFHLAHELVTASDGLAAPRLYLACGTEDPLLAESRKFKEHLDALALPSSYQEAPGRHDWVYWDRAIQDVLAWLPLE